jgi:hypothetical protein
MMNRSLHMKPHPTCELWIMLGLPALTERSACGLDVLQVVWSLCP